MSRASSCFIHAASGALGVMVLAAVLSGCSALGGIAGAVTGAGAGAATGNPGAGIAVAIGVRAAVDAAMMTLDRRLHDKEQQIIAAQIGATPVGEERAWQVRNPFSYQDSQGRLRVLREFTTALVECREALFTVDEESDTADTGTMRPVAPHYLTTVCRDGQQDWQWALAEPAAARWGALQ